jgi:hypothetical protein
MRRYYFITEVKKEGKLREYLYIPWKHQVNSKLLFNKSLFILIRDIYALSKSNN